ncbi:MAG TPA: hypothetical protein VM513_16695 [Kofleriaceae bacterium]|nr:hypothetical protein [Kofleriaceae bacterium]
MTRQLAHVPGAITASVTITRPVDDPLAAPLPRRATQSGSLAPRTATAAALIIVDDHADRDAISAAAATLLRAVAPEVTAPNVVTMIGAHRPELAKVGPFTVEAGSKGTLKAALALALAAIAGLAAWIAVRERQRRPTA